MSEQEPTGAPPPPAPLLASLLQLMRLRGSPADLPDSIIVLGWLVALDALASGYLMGLIAPEQAVLPPLLLSLTLHLLLPWLLLRQLGMAHRYVQTAIAYTGVDTLLTALIAVAGSLDSGLFTTTEPVGELAVVLSLVVSVTFIWQVIAIGHIYRCALILHLIGGVLVTLGLMISQAYLGNWILGA
ncbi:MAG: hypothetical protein KDI71_00990 [Xanthomonadales bacterium]|nr:hypothetical protein [Xanthomonadales bacterium]